MDFWHISNTALYISASEHPSFIRSSTALIKVTGWKGYEIKARWQARIGYNGKSMAKFFNVVLCTLFYLFIYLLGFAVQRLMVCRTLGPTACSRMFTHEKNAGIRSQNPWLHLHVDNLKPATIWFTFNASLFVVNLSICRLSLFSIYRFKKLIEKFTVVRETIPSSS